MLDGYMSGTTTSATRSPAAAAAGDATSASCRINAAISSAAVRRKEFISILPMSSDRRAGERDCCSRGGTQAGADRRRLDHSGSESGWPRVAETRGSGGRGRDDAAAVEEQVAACHSPKLLQIHLGELGPLRRDDDRVRGLTRLADRGAHADARLRRKVAHRWVIRADRETGPQ